MRILVVDDSKVTLKLLADTLAAWGHLVVTAQDGRVAWEILRVEPPELLLTDWEMPGMDGLELAQRVRARGPASPRIWVMLHSSANQRGDAMSQLEKGNLDDFLAKPCSPAELRARLAMGQRVLALENRVRLQTQELNRLQEQQNEYLRQGSEQEVQRLLAALELKDVETASHVRRIGQISAIMAEAWGWPAQGVRIISMAAPMHDIGKIGLPDNILQKPGPLSPREFEVVKRHAAIGEKLFRGSDQKLLGMAREIAGGHHERWDGRGYPKGRGQQQISGAARIVAIADVFDALSSHRIYRRALPENTVLGMMRQERGGQFDPKLLDLFWDLLPQLRDIRHEFP